MPFAPLCHRADALGPSIQGELMSDISAPDHSGGRPIPGRARQRQVLGGQVLGRRGRVLAAAAALTGLAVAGCSTVNKTTTSAAATPAVGAGKVPVGNFGPESALISMKQVCGTKKVKVGLVDGQGVNSWSKIVRAEVDAEAAQCPQVAGVSYAAGGGSLQTTLSAITSMVSQGVKILLVIPDAGTGASQLPALRAATKAGVTVVPIASDPTGTAPADYFDYVDWDPATSGEVWAKWMVARLGAKGGNIVMLGGPAGNSVSTEEMTGIKQVLATAPQVKLLTSQPVTTNWDPAMAQQAMSSLLAKYPKIDGVIADYGASATGVLRAYQSAGRPLVPLASTDDNQLSCGYAALKKKNPDYQLATISSRTWIGRVGLRKALADINGKADPEPSRVQLNLYEDSTGTAPGAHQPSADCQPSLPADAPPSSQLSVSSLATLFGK
jgi:ribose transport system substrate-binding protein